MKPILITIILTLSVHAQKAIALKLTNENPFKIVESFRLVDEKEGFYDEVIARAAPNGTLYIYDKGNKLCHKFDKKGKHISSFGKEGNGPGEFSQFVIDFTATNDRLLFKNAASRSVMFFTTDGKFITDVKGNLLIGAQVVDKGDKIEFHFPKNELSETLSMTFDKDGNELSKVKNEAYEEGAMQRMQQGFNDDQLKKNLERPRSFMPFNGGYMQHYTGSYKIDFVNSKYEITKTFTNDYNRVKIEDIMDLVPRQQRKFMENAPEERRKMFMQIFDKVQKELGGFHPDIIDILGSHGNYLFVQTQSSDKKKLKLHIISSSDKLVQEVELNCDEITSAKVMNGYLLVNQTNEEDGPFASVYKL